jgi:hypothetical protein
VQNAAARRRDHANCTTAAGALWHGDGRPENKQLAVKVFLCGREGWHVSRDGRPMIVLIISFVVIGSLLCLLVGADHQASDAVEAARVRVFEKR